MAPLGKPVVPEVYMIRARSSSATGSTSGSGACDCRAAKACGCVAGTPASRRWRSSGTSAGRGQRSCRSGSEMSTLAPLWARM